MAFRLPAIPVHVESALRISISAMVAYSLSYADLPKIIPNSLRWVIGFLAPTIVMRVPNFTLVISAVIPAMYTVAMIGLAATTGLLAAATVSDGLFVGLSSLWSLWLSGFRYGKLGKVTYVFTPALVTFLALVGLGLRGFVANGVTIIVSNGLLSQQIEDSISIPPQFADYLGLILQAVRTILSGATDGQGVGIEIESGVLQGQTFYLELTDPRQDLVIRIPGGLWIVRGLWTWSGLDNPLAMMQNLLVVVSWTILCIIISPALPPWRTARHLVSHDVLPAALRDAARYIAIYSPSIAPIKQAEDDQQEEDTASKEELDKEQAAEDEKPNEKDPSIVRVHLIEHANTLHGGLLAIVTAFEPRLLDYRCGLPSCTYLKLHGLVLAVEQTVLRALVFKVASHDKPLVILPDLCQETVEAIERCATSIQERTLVTTHRGQGRNTGTPTETENTERIQGTIPADTEQQDRRDDPIHLAETTQLLISATNTWVESMNPGKGQITPKEGAKNLLLNTVPLIGPSLLICARLLEIVFSPLLLLRKKPIRWDTGKLFHHVKFAAGFGALISMAVYWDAFAAYEINEDVAEVIPGINITGASPPKSFSGWVLISYAFATMPTMEGTVKKCALRIVGTLLGGFSVWLALLALEDNKVGLVAWFTITTFVVMCFSVSRHPVKGRMGTSDDYGYWGFYFVLTQSVVAMEVFAGIGSRDELVVNRIVSNLTGIAMASLLAVIPPTVAGADPRRAGWILTEMKQGLVDGLQLLLTAEESSYESLKALNKHSRTEIDDLRADALFLLKDAKRFTWFPFYRVDPALEREISDLTISGSLTTFLLESANEKLMKEEFAEGGKLHASVASILVEMKSPQEMAKGVTGGGDTPPDSKHSQHGATSDEEVCSSEDAMVFIKGLRLLQERLLVHATNLEQVKWGWRPSY